MYHVDTVQTVPSPAGTAISWEFAHQQPELPWSKLETQEENQEAGSYTFQGAEFPNVWSFLVIPDQTEQRVKNSTAQAYMPNELYEEFRSLFAAGKEEFFEDGVESEFSRTLSALVEQHNDIAIDILNNLINIRKMANPEVAAEALRWIGHSEESSSRILRRRLLEWSLHHPSAYVRDGAVLGLSFMDDPNAIPSLRSAIARETVIDELRQDMQQVLNQLQDTQLES